jgi:hypothetical protein
LAHTVGKQGVDLRVISPRRAHWMLPDPRASAEEVLKYVFQTAVACRLPSAKRKSKRLTTP